MDEKTGLTGQEVDAMTTDMDAAADAPEASASDRAAAEDEMRVRGQTPEDKS